MKLTGRIRHRAQSRLFRSPLLILQVEETGEVEELNGGYIDRSTVTRWRDAKLEDGTVEER